MITFYHSPTVNFSSIFRVYRRLNLLFRCFTKFRVNIFFADNSKKIITCNASALVKYLPKYQGCIIYVFGILDNKEHLILEQDELSIKFFEYIPPFGSVPEPTYEPPLLKILPDDWLPF